MFHVDEEIKAIIHENYNQYKEHLQQEYLEDSKFYGEEFTENSLLVYLKIKVLEKF